MQHTREMTIEIFRLVRQAISPLAKIHGPLFAGVFDFGGLHGPVFLTASATWVWLPERMSQLKSGESDLDDTRLSTAIDIFTMLLNLLTSTKSSIDKLLRHLNRIRTAPTFLTDVGLYLINPEARTGEIVQAEHMAEFHQPDPNPALPSIEDVLSDFAASDWLKKALRSALDRDVVDAANDAEVLAQLLNARCCQP